MPCDWYLDMGRILGQVADEGISVINFFAWLFQAPRAIRFLLVTSVTGRVREELSSAMKQEGRHSGWHALLLASVAGNRRPIIALNGWHSMQPTMRSAAFTSAKPDYNRLFNGCPSDWQDPAWLAICYAGWRDIKEFYTALDQGTHRLFGRRAVP